MRDGEYLRLEDDKGQALADQLVGKSRAEAEAAVRGWRLMAVVIDLDMSGGRVVLTRDHVPGRIRIFLHDGRVTQATYG